jgi:hypothetical protein
MNRIKYQVFTNEQNNENLSKINRLLEQIGTDSKSLLNKLQLKKSKSKSIEFLELIDENLDKILKNINLQNIRKQFDKSKKLFEKLLGQTYLNKIQSKSENTKTRLIRQKNDISRKYLKFFINFSEEIVKIINSNILSIEELYYLLSIQIELISLLQTYYKTQDNYSDVLNFMKRSKKFIEKKIYLIIPNDKSRNISKLFSESNSLYNEVKNMNTSALTSEKKKELADNIFNLAKFIFMKKNVLNKDSYQKSIDVLNKLNELYFLIFQKEYNTIQQKSHNYHYYSKFNNIIPNRNTYENLVNKKSDINNFIIKLAEKARE